MRKTFTCILTFLFFSFSSSSQNRGLQFDGIDDYVSIPEKDGVLTTENFTVELWVKPGNNFSVWPYLLRKTDAFYSSGMDVLFNDNGPYGTLEATIYRFFAGTTVRYTLPTDWTGQWHHLAFSFNGLDLTLFIDGSPVGTAATGGLDQVSTGAPVLLGAYDPDSGLNYEGVMDELRFWNFPRSQSQIQADMNKEIPPNSPGLVAYYRFNQGVANGNNTAITLLTDGVAPPSHGTLLNFAKSGGSTSNFTAGYGSITVLALTDGSFTATKKNNTVQLDWKAFFAGGPVSFTVERSAGGLSFEPLATLVATVFHTENNYSYVDATPSAAINFYRLKVNEENRPVTYSQTIAVAMDRARQGIQVVPNPAFSYIQVQLREQKTAVLIQLIDASGTILQSIYQHPTGSGLFTSFDVTAYKSGLYFIRVGTETAPFLKQ